MLKLEIGTESWDEENKEFVLLNSATLELEHSLVSLSKWEQKWEIPFLSKEEKTTEQTLDYVRCMLLSEDVPEDLLSKLDDRARKQINEYINAKMTATTFAEINQAPNSPAKGDVITSELVYYWMVALTIPWEAQYWHINRLFTLIRVCNAKNQPQKTQRVTKQDQLAQRRALNAQRKQQYGTSG